MGNNVPSADSEQFADYLVKLSGIGKALSTEKDQNKLLELIIRSAMDFTRADGGTLYLMGERDQLDFSILHNDSLGIHMGGTSGVPINLYPVELYDDDGAPNMRMVSAQSAITCETINIPDAYASTGFDFSGTRKIDKKHGYRSTSFLTVPMVDHEDQVIGVLQLINAISPDTGEIVPFNELHQALVESLASQAAVSITNAKLILGQKKLFDSFIQLIASAIDEKSPYTAGHCRRVPVLTRMIAEGVNATGIGPLADFSMSEEEMYELDVAAWLHDCGKITTPEYVVDKASKLETIFDRIGLVDMRFEMLKQRLIIESLLRKMPEMDSIAELLADDAELREAFHSLDDERQCVRASNLGGESIDEEQIRRLTEIARQEWDTVDGGRMCLLEKDELSNLLINRGTLSVREREIINNHVTVTIKMLKALPYPRHLQRVPEYAGGHHEKMDGSGYPNGLLGKDMSLPARMLAIADIFEALTARDRPYKKAMPLSQALTILAKMKRDNHIDPDLFDVFIYQKVYLRYAREYLPPHLLDEVKDEELMVGSPLLSG